MLVINCTEAEHEFIELLRGIGIEFGKLPVTIIFQDGRIEGIEYQDPTIRKHIKKSKIKGVT